jgi:prepilin-type N-terminal cleavage/methylation domain-containing protein
VLLSEVTIGRHETGTRGARGRGFTLVELIVVVTVIVLVLALAVPGLNAMNAEARFASATQKVNGMITRAYYLSVAESAMTAVRFAPTEWVLKQEGAGEDRKTQSVVVYRYGGRTDRQVGGQFRVGFEEYFEPVESISPVELPNDVWVAPSAALSGRSVSLGGSTLALGRDLVLDGQLNDPGRSGEHYFELDADRYTSTGGGRLLNADDFLLVFDPQTGLRTGTPEAFQLRAYDPRPDSLYQTGLQETAGERDANGDFISGTMFRRYNFSGLVFYRREPFLSLESRPIRLIPQERQEYLRLNGRPYLVHRFGGGLEQGAQGQE